MSVKFQNGDEIHRVELIDCENYEAVLKKVQYIFGIAQNVVLSWIDEEDDHLSVTASGDYDVALKIMRKIQESDGKVPKFFVHPISQPNHDHSASCENISSLFPSEENEYIMYENRLKCNLKDKPSYDGIDIDNDDQLISAMALPDSMPLSDKLWVAAAVRKTLLTEW